MSGHRKKRRAPPLLQRIDVEQKRLAAILERTRTVLNAEEHATLSSLVDTVAWVQAELQTKDASLERLRKMIFGASTESTRHVLGGEATEKHEHGSASSPAPIDPSKPRLRPPGHGRNAAAAYTGAEQVSVRHPHLHGGEACPGCTSGKLYAQSEPAKLVRITGMAPLSATSMVGLLKYGAGLPFNRIEKLQDGMGIPLPAATQWDLVQAAAKPLTPAHEQLLHQAVSFR